MNGGQDLGGVHGFGAIQRETDEPVFHHPWERRVFANTLALGMLGRWNIDMSRYARENRDPAEYLRSSYYELWLKGLERLAVERGLITAEELRSGSGKRTRDESLAPPGPTQAVALLQGRRGARLDVQVPARFAVGDLVRVKNVHPATHTRMPRYCRAKAGTVAIDHGVYIFPDTHAHGLGQKPQHCYSVQFTAKELWGTAQRDSVHVDLWDDYLEKA